MSDRLNLDLQGDWDCPFGMGPVGIADKPPMRGLGDLIAKATTALGVKPCGACKRRQAALNAAIPFHKTADLPPVGQ